MAAVDRVGARAGWQAGDLGRRVFRHTFTAARLQTLDRDAPVSLYTVSRELGHGSEEMVRRAYAHLGTVRHRSEVVGYRVGQHLDALKDRLGALGFVTAKDPTAGQGIGNDEPRTPITDGGVKSSESGPGATRTRELLLRRGVPPMRRVNGRENLGVKPAARW